MASSSQVTAVSGSCCSALRNNMASPALNLHHRHCSGTAVIPTNIKGKGRGAQTAASILQAEGLASLTPAKTLSAGAALSSSNCLCLTPLVIPSRELEVRTAAGGSLCVAAAGGPPSPSSRPHGFQERVLGDFAWVFGARPSAFVQQPCTSNVFCPCPSCDDDVSLPSSHASVHSTAKHVQATTADPEEVSTAPLVTLASLVRDTFRDAERNCRGEMARLGKDKDADVVHDLRVVLRRLRNMLRLFSSFIDLKKELDPRAVSRLLRALGVVRDSGAMVETLEKVEARIAPAAAAAEPAEAREEAAVASALRLVGGSDPGRMASALEGVRQELRELEQRQLAEACRELRSKHGRSLFNRLKAWAEKPSLHFSQKKDHGARHGPLAKHDVAVLEGPLSWLSPSILAPYVSSLLLHPGWHIDDIWTPSTGDEEQRGNGAGSNSAAFGRGDAVGEPDEHLCETAHDLRKHLRELRYAMELLLPAYSVPGSPSISAPVESRQYREALLRVKELQGVLGNLQDLQVLAAFLRGVVGRHVAQQERLIKGKGARRSSRREQAAELGEAVEALEDVCGVILKLQKEVWSQWLVEREKVNSAKGRSKLFRAMTLKPGQQARMMGGLKQGGEGEEEEESGEEEERKQDEGEEEEGKEESVKGSVKGSNGRGKARTPADAAAAVQAVLAAEAQRAALSSPRHIHKPTFTPVTRGDVSEDESDSSFSMSPQHSLLQHVSLDSPSTPASPKRRVIRAACRLWSSRNLEAPRSLSLAPSLSSHWSPSPTPLPSLARSASAPDLRSLTEGQVEVAYEEESLPEPLDWASTSKESVVAARSLGGEAGGDEAEADGVPVEVWGAGFGEEEAEVLPQELLPSALAQILALEDLEDAVLSSSSPGRSPNSRGGHHNSSNSSSSGLFKGRGHHRAPQRAEVLAAKAQREEGKGRTDAKGR